MGAPASHKGGRPRKDGTTAADPRKEILSIATKLFIDDGFSETTMSAIAREAGLDQSSLYYWFSSKGKILAEIMSSNRYCLDLATKLIGLDGPRAPQLFAVIVSDVKQLCEQPIDYYEFEAVMKSNSKLFEDFSSIYHQLNVALAELISLGVESGEFVSVDCAAAAFAVLSLDEGIQHRYHQSRNNLEWEQVPPISSAASTPVSLGILSARVSLASLVNDTSTLDGIQRMAEDSGWI